MKKLKKLKTLSTQGGACSGSFPRQTGFTYKKSTFLSGCTTTCGSTSYYCANCDERCDTSGGGGGGTPYFEQ